MDVCCSHGGHRRVHRQISWDVVVIVGGEENAILSRTQKSYDQNLLYREMSTRSGSNLILCVPIDFYSYTCNNIY
jgi:hypothetical protein